MSEPVQFVFSRGRLAAIAFCALFSGLLFFGAGIATGLLLRPDSIKPKPEISWSGQTPITPMSTAPPLAITEENKPAEITDNSSSTAVQKSEEGVIINVASYPQRATAANFASMLKRQGFGPVHTGQHEIQGQVLYYVHVGPFRAWEEASKIAAELDESYDLHTSVIPAKSAS